MRRYPISFLILTGCLLAAELNAATLAGRVTDPAGKPIAHARVSVFTRDGQDRVSVSTDASGEYRVESLGQGEYLIEAESAGMSRSTPRPVAMAADRRVDIALSLNTVRTEVVVTATGGAQSSDETAKAVDTISAAELAHSAVATVAEGLKSTAGVRVQTLGGPGGYTQILTRGLRAQDTAVTIDGLRFRDAGTPQGDATPFLEDMFLVDTERIEMLRGTGSSVYGSNAIGGVMNLVTDSGGGPLHGEIRAEGGGLGMMRGVARVAGGRRSGALNFSAGVQSTDVLSGVDGDDRYRNTSAQGSLQLRPSTSTRLTARVWAANSFAQVNSTPYAAPSNLLPAHGTIGAAPVSLATQHLIETGQPFSYSGANFVPALDDPDSRRASGFLSGALIFHQQLNRKASYSVTYHRVITRRRFDDGPAGAGYQPSFSGSDHIRGGTDTIEARFDVQATRWNTLSAGYEFERESYRSRHIDYVPAPLAGNYFTAAGQRDNSVFAAEQIRLLGDRLQIGLSARLQSFGLRAPVFDGGIPVFQGMRFQSPRRAKTGDASAAYFIPKSGTKLRAHTGNGYRAPSIFERFGSGFFMGAFEAYGDPRLRPERTMAFDAGVDQYFAGQKVKVSATWFYTNLQETIAFDFSGYVNPATDPFGRWGGYINTGGGIARGGEFSVESAAYRTLRIKAAYTYTNAAVRKSLVADHDFCQSPNTPPHVFSLTATQRFGRRFDVTGDVWIASRYAALFSSRAFYFEGPRKVDVTANYTLPVKDHVQVRLYTKAMNVFASNYLEDGYRTPGRWGIGGVSLEF